MNFSSQEDIDAPIEEVFAMMAEFDAYERAALRRGIDVRRGSEDMTVGVGMKWDATFSLRGAERDVTLELTEFDRPNTMRFDADSQGLDAVLTIDLMSLSARQTRMSIIMDLTPKTLPARLLVQSLKLAKTNLTKRFTSKVSDFARAMEDRSNRERMA